MASVGQSIFNTAEEVKNFQKSFQQFTAYNIAFVTIAAALCVGMATNEMITHIMNDALLPLFTFIAQRNIAYYMYNKVLDMSIKYPILTMVIRKCGRIIWLMLVWFMVLYLTYFIFSYAIRFDIMGRQINLVQSISKLFTRQEAHGQVIPHLPGGPPSVPSVIGVGIKPTDHTDERKTNKPISPIDSWQPYQPYLANR